MTTAAAPMVLEKPLTTLSGDDLGFLNEVIFASMFSMVEQATPDVKPAARNTVSTALTFARKDIPIALETTRYEKRQENAAIWKDGKEPPTFDAWCEILDGKRMYPRQEKCLREAGLLSPYSILDPERTIQQVVLIWGKGSGKDYIIGKLVSWVAFVLCSLEDDPANFFGLAPTSRLSIMNVAPTKLQAKKVFFDQYLKKFIKHKIFRDRGFITDRRDGGKQIHADDVMFHRVDADGNEYESIGLFSMHSKATSVEGHNIFCAIMDEADAFLDNSDKSNAEDIYLILQSSASTRFMNRWLMFVISYPAVEGGFMLRLRDTAIDNINEYGSRANYYVDLAATHEVNPRFDINAPVVKAHFKRDPRGASAVYLCIPQATLSAFFEYYERIAESVDHTRKPCAIVTEQNISLMQKSGNELFYITGVVSNIQRVPGYQYFMGIDAGAKKDAYAVSIWHSDVQKAQSAQWLCPRCGRLPEYQYSGMYDKMPLGAREPYFGGDEIHCGGCFATPLEFDGSFSGKGTIHMVDWHKLSARDENHMDILDPQGKPYTVAPLYEDLLVRIKPQQATRPGEKNKLVYFPGMSAMIKQLVVGLAVTAVRLDPYQTYEVTQGLIGSTGGDIQEMSFSNTDQHKRARWARSMLYGGLLSFLPNEERDHEWKRLQLVGANKIDHPPGAGEGKDLFDTESMCIWAASAHRDSRLEVDYI